MRLYNTIVDRARRKEMLPNDAPKILDELKRRLGRLIRETGFQRKDRLDKEFENLEMGRKTHSEFRTLWEEKMEDMEAAGMEIVENKDTLCRKYLSKLTTELRRAVMQQTWPL